MWLTDPTHQAAWLATNTRAKPPKMKPDNAAAKLPPTAQPMAAGTSSPANPQTG